MAKNPISINFENATIEIIYGPNNRKRSEVWKYGGYVWSDGEKIPFVYFCVPCFLQNISKPFSCSISNFRKHLLFMHNIVCSARNNEEPPAKKLKTSTIQDECRKLKLNGEGEIIDKKKSVVPEAVPRRAPVQVIQEAMGLAPAVESVCLAIASFLKFLSPQGQLEALAEIFSILHRLFVKYNVVEEREQ